MNARGTLIVPALLVALACAQEPAEEADSMAMDDSAAMEETAPTVDALAKAQEISDAYVAAYNAGDAAAVSALYTVDGILMDAMGGTSEGRAAIEANETEGMGMFPTLEVTTVEAHAMGDGAVGRGTYTIGGGEAGSIGGTWMANWVPGADGAWKIQWLHVNQTMAEGDAMGAGE